MGKPRPVDVTIDAGVRHLQPLLMSAFGAEDSTPTIVVETVAVENTVVIARHSEGDDEGCYVHVLVFEGHELLRTFGDQKWHQFALFLEACDSQWGPHVHRMLMVSGTTSTHSKLLGAAAIVAMQHVPWSWCPTANAQEAAARISAISTYVSRGNDIKVREDGYSMRKQRKCEGTDFFALYRSMLCEIQGITSRQVSNVMSVAPTIDCLMTLLENEAPDYPTLSRCNGYGEHREVGVGVARIIARAMNAPLGDAHRSILTG
ncbi:Hypothetical protein, putative [Bodo saltans]|uniref:Uncharacterized protein n=1 Tax=Bodo saltans TaxID=75058 RepID=A0A0S4IZ05_BODSA|nr:Hypothetical protein, putative [Bodo saltans]|eukprot:CUG61908.1 Hypothetical protein, putative [Bodo saltans]